MSGWTYIKSGALEDETIGPITDQELLQCAHDGEIKLDTRVVHPAHTRGQWVMLSQIPAAKQHFERGQAERQQHKQQLAEEKQRQKQAAKSASQARKQAAIQEAAEQKARSPIAKFLLDGQSEATVASIYERVQEILTSTESIQYIAVQAKPVQIAPDCVVLTNRRFIVFRQKMLGQMTFDDYLWRDLHDAQVSEGVMFATMSLTAINGVRITIEYLPKSQARQIYRIAQEREEEAIEERRRREMEETRAGASNVVVNAPSSVAQAPTAAPEAAADDPMAKLAKLKQMMDAGLIEQSEYETTKQRILESF